MVFLFYHLGVFTRGCLIFFNVNVLIENYGEEVYN